MIDQTLIETVVLTSIGDMLGLIKGTWFTFAARHLKGMVPAFKISLSTPRGQERKVLAFSDLLANGSSLSLKSANVNLSSTAFLQYTGGTTGLSKGAVLTHGNIISAGLQAEAWFTPAVKRIGDVRKVNAIAALPLYHIFALNLCLLSIRWGPI